jgi:hypothetical protein
MILGGLIPINLLQFHAVSASEPPAESASAGNRPAENAIVEQASATKIGREPLLDRSTAPFVFEFRGGRSMVCEAGQNGTLGVRIDSLPDQAGATLQLEYRLVRVADGENVQREEVEVTLDDQGISRTVDLSSSAPELPGVYEVRCHLLEKNDKLWSKFTGEKSRLSSTAFPTVVTAASASAHGSEKHGSGKPGNSDWQPIGTVRALETLGMQTPEWMPATSDWIPERATKLVPDVRRVGESLTLSPWKESKRTATLAELPAGRSFVGRIPSFTAHDAHRLDITMEAIAPGTKPIPLKVEWAETSDFRSPLKTAEFWLTPTADIAQIASELPVRFQHIWFPAKTQRFLKVTNQSTSSTVRIKAIGLARTVERSGDEGSATVGKDGDHVASASDRSATSKSSQRRVMLLASGEAWVERLTDDFAPASPANDPDYSTTTSNVFRWWKATTRLSVLSQWAVFDDLRMTLSDSNPPTPTSKSAATDSHDASTNRLVKQIVAEAMPRWLEETGFATDVADGSTDGIEAEEAVSRGDGSTVAGPDPVAVQCHFDGSATRPRLSQFPGQIAVRDLPAAITAERPTEVRIPIDQVLSFITEKELGLLRELRATPCGKTVKIANAEDSPSVAARVFQQVTDTGTLRRVTLINDAPWSQEIELSFSGERPDFRRPSPNSGASDISGESAPGTRWRLVPKSIVNLEVAERAEGSVATAGKTTVNSYRAVCSGGAVTTTRIQNQVGDVVRKIGLLAQPPRYEVFRNGGFETKGQVGIVGWMHSQFPADAVSLDSTEAIEGTTSVRMVTDRQSSGRTWLVSKAIRIPASGRLAVSIAARAAIKPQGRSHASSGPSSAGVGQLSSGMTSDLASSAAARTTKNSSTATHRLRVSLEGTRNGQPVRFVAEHEVPCTGEWQPRRVVLEAEPLEPNSIESLRLTIDSLSAGTLWIDDVQLHDDFATEVERAELQGDAFLAVQGLQRGDLSPAARLLDNHWSQILILGDAGNGSSTRVASKPTDAEVTNQNSANEKGRVNASLSMLPKLTPKPAWTAPPEEASSRPAVKPTEPDAKAPGTTPKRQSMTRRLRDWLPRPIRF